MMSLLCRIIWVVQSLDKVVDRPVIVNDNGSASNFIVDNDSGMLLLVLLVLHFALHSRRLPAGLVCLFISSFTPGFNLDAPTQSSLVFA